MRPFDKVPMLSRNTLWYLLLVGSMAALAALAAFLLELAHRH